MLRVSYWLDESTGNYLVTLHLLSQTIVLLPGFFKRVIGMEGKILAGTTEMSVDKLLELGFVFPSVYSRKIV